MCVPLFIVYDHIYIYLVHVELPLCIALIHCFISGTGVQHAPETLAEVSGNSALPCPFVFESAKLLATSTSAVEWYKSHAHILFLSEVIQILQIKLNVNEV